MSEPFLGQISFFGFGFAPQRWAQCQGQILPIQQYAALFSLLGTQFGGDGVRTFGLPDLRGRIPVGQGQGPGLQDYQMGEIDGVETVVLNGSMIPGHTHTVPAVSANATTNIPASGTLPAIGHAGQHQNVYNINDYAPPTTGTATTLAPAVLVAASGGPGAHTNLQPTLAGNWCIALTGMFPSRG
jgi:microcystin-dependent protein